MIIFNLDGTLANCEHRRRFVDPSKIPCGCMGFTEPERCVGLCERASFKPNWPAFYEACDKDEPILPVFEIMHRLDKPYQIWSGRCESIRKKTEDWLCKYTPRSSLPPIKMRPIGDNTPDDVLKERWLEETYEETKWGRRTPIDFVFDDRPKVVRMWRRWGIFVFDCNQVG